MSFTIHHIISWAEPAGRNAQLDRIEKIQTHILTIMSQLSSTLDEVFAVVKAEKDATAAVVKLIDGLAEQIKAGIGQAADLAAAQETAANILAVAKENAAALVAAVNHGTPDQTDADVAVVAEFEAAPPQPIDAPVDGPK